MFLMFLVLGMVGMNLVQRSIDCQTSSCKIEIHEKFEMRDFQSLCIPLLILRAVDMMSR